MTTVLGEAPRWRHVIWDWNGTLLDDAWLCVEVMNGLLSQRSLPLLDLQRYQEVFDFPVRDYYRRLGFDLERDRFEVVGTEFIRIYETRRHEAVLRPEAITVLSALRQLGASQSVLSAYRHDTLETLLNHFQLRGFFDHVLGAEDHYAHGKVEQGRRLMTTLNANPADVVLVGDTTHDHDVARELGIHCLLIPGQHHDREKLERRGVPVLSDLHELVSLARRG